MRNIFILLSIKTRIETPDYHIPGDSVWIFILLSIKTRIETMPFHNQNSGYCHNFYPTIH